MFPAEHKTNFLQCYYAQLDLVTCKCFQFRCRKGNFGKHYYMYVRLAYISKICLKQYKLCELIGLLSDNLYEYETEST